MSNLTPKQEKLCQKFIELGNASEAYRQSYNAENMKPETIHRKVHDLLKQDKIAARVRELQLKIEEKFEITAIQKKKWLQEVVESCIKPMIKTVESGDVTDQIQVGLVDPKAVISAIAELNKMDGHLAAIKTDSKVSGSVSYRQDLGG